MDPGFELSVDQLLDDVNDLRRESLTFCRPGQRFDFDVGKAARSVDVDGDDVCDFFEQCLADKSLALLARHAVDVDADRRRQHRVSFVVDVGVGVDVDVEWDVGVHVVGRSETGLNRKNITNWLICSQTWWLIPIYTKT